MDTILTPISQFNFTVEDIESRFDGDIDAKLRGVNNIAHIRRT
jgi:hypothetical protein